MLTGKVCLSYCWFNGTQQSFFLSFFLTLGVSLMCYNCLDPVSPCRTNITCSPNQDSCLIAVSGKGPWASRLSVVRSENLGNWT